MSENKLRDSKDKVVGTAKEATGKVINNEELELKGKLQKDIAKSKEAANDLKDKRKDEKEEVVEETEEFTNQVDKNNDFIMEGKDPDDCY